MTQGRKNEKTNKREADWSSLTPEEKRRELFNRQKATLITLLERKAITREQYEKSYRILAEQMGFDVS
jgi:hypothetical protein